MLFRSGQNPASFALKQFAYLIVGFFGLKYFMNLDYKKLRDWAVPFAWFVIVMLALVDFTPLGVIVNGARRWIMLGPIQFQPSEMTKFAVIMLLANAFYRDANIFSSTKWSRYFVPILIMVFLVFKRQGRALHAAPACRQMGRRAQQPHVRSHLPALSDRYQLGIVSFEL